MRKSSADASGLLLVLIGLLLAGGTAAAIWAFQVDPIKNALAEDRVLNTLFIIEDEGKPLGAYVLMYYPGTKRAAVFDIPGNLGLILQKLKRVDRIDTVYESAKPAPYEEEVEKLLGQDIAFSLIINIENIGKIVDLLEGVDLFIHSPVAVYGDDGPILFPSGMTRLDGDKASLYLTYSLPEEDDGSARLRRQRFFLGFVRRLGEQDGLLSAKDISHLFFSLLRSTTDERNLRRLFGEFPGVNMDRVSIQSVTGNTREVSGQILIFPFYDGTLIKEIVRQTLGGLVRPLDSGGGERVYTVEVLNGTTTNGLAGRTAALLQGFGYDVTRAANADSQDYAETQIIDRSGEDAAASEFGDVIKCENIRVETPAQTDAARSGLVQSYQDFPADFTLILGRDFDGRYVNEE